MDAEELEDNRFNELLDLERDIIKIIHKLIDENWNNESNRLEIQKKIKRLDQIRTELEIDHEASLNER